MTSTFCQLACVLLATCLLVDHSHGFFFSSRRRSSSYPHDITSQSRLSRLYNSRVTRAEHWQRPLEGWSRMIGPFRHSGVVVTTADGHRWLVHKGNDYGLSSETVVVDADHMSDRWSRVRSQPVHNSRVSDYVRAGGPDYSLLTDNCHSGRCRMMNLD